MQCLISDFAGYTDAVLELNHDTQGEILVDGFPGPGSYVRPITYNAPHKEELNAIIDRAFTCDQYIKYTCYQSKLLSDACKSVTVTITAFYSFNQ